NNCLPSGTDGQDVGVLVYLLPYMEQQARFQNFSFDPTYPVYWRNPLNRPPSTGTTTIPRPPAVYGCEGNIKRFLCPSSIPPEQDVTVYIAIDDGKPGKDFPAAAGGSGYGYSGYPGGLVMGRSNYLGVGGFFAPSYASYASPKYAQYY